MTRLDNNITQVRDLVTDYIRASTEWNKSKRTVFLRISDLHENALTLDTLGQALFFLNESGDVEDDYVVKDEEEMFQEEMKKPGEDHTVATFRITPQFLNRQKSVHGQHTCEWVMYDCGIEVCITGEHARVGKRPLDQLSTVEVRILNRIMKVEANRIVTYRELSDNGGNSDNKKTLSNHISNIRTALRVALRGKKQTIHIKNVNNQGYMRTDS